MLTTRTAMSSKASLALMKFLSDLTKRLGVAEHVYVVGGAVRNFVIDRPIKDLDVVIDAMETGRSRGKARDSSWLATQLSYAIPAATRITPDNHGVTVLHITGDWMLQGENLKGEEIEIANARKESYAQSGSKPTVEPATLQEDVYRRDFTFNTLMWRLLDLADGPDKAEILDITGCGLRDLLDRTMKCPKDPDKTFADDPTRMLRAVKFITQYGFDLPLDVKRAIEKNAPKLKNVASSNLLNIVLNTFLRKGLSGPALKEMKRLGVLDVLKEIIQEDKSFRDALANWADREAEVEHLFDLMDFGLPSGKRLSMLDRYQLERAREVTVRMTAAEASLYVTTLKQPGKVMDTRALMKEFGLKGRAMASLMEQARLALLDDPTLMKSKQRLTQRLREGLQGGKVAGEYTEFLRQQAKQRRRDKDAKSFTLDKGDPVLMGKYKNSPGRIEGFGDNGKGDPTVKIRKTPKGDKGKGSVKEVNLFKIRYDKDQAAKDRAKKAVARVASRYVRTAGLFEPPPKMVESILGWVLSQVSANLIAEIQRENRRLRKEHQEFLKSRMVREFEQAIAQLESVAASGGTRAVYAAYKAFWDVCYGMFGYGIPEHKQKAFTRIQQRRAEVVKLVSDAIKAARERFAARNNDRIIGKNNDTIKALKKYRRTGTKPMKGAEVVREFPIDLTDWYIGPERLQQYRDDAMSSLDTSKANPEMIKLIQDTFGKAWSTLEVRLAVLLETKSQASWHPVKKILSIQVPSRRSPSQLEKNLRRSVEHELRHFGQSIMADVLGTGDSWLHSRKPGPGMPSKRIRTPQFHQEHTMSDDGRPQSRREQRRKRELHHLDDVEFHTDLVDAIHRIKDDIEDADRRRQQYKMDPLTYDERKAYFKALVGLKVDRRLREKLYLSSQPIDSFFFALKRRAEGKYRKAVGEAWKVLFGGGGGGGGSKLATLHTLVLDTGADDIVKKVPSDSLPYLFNSTFAEAVTAGGEDKTVVPLSLMRTAARPEMMRVAATVDRSHPETLAWVQGFFARHSKLRRYSGIPVVHVEDPSRQRHPEASWSRGSIELYPKFRKLSKGIQDFVFAHEIGHAVLSRWGSPKFMAAAEAAGVDPWDTPNLPFAQHNFDEAFADCFASYHIDGDVQRRYPEWARVVEAALAVVKSAAKFKKKKTVKNQKGESQVVYEYSERQVANRHREKAKKVEKLRQNLGKLRGQVKKDLSSDDPKTWLSALAVGLMNDTYERVGNDQSAKDGHFGVTGWQAKHVTVSGGKATFTYVGKSGVKQKKTTTDAGLVKAVKKALEGKSGTDPLFEVDGTTVGASDVNKYLKPHGITAKDIRGLHANREMQSRLKAIRGKGGTLPTDKKKREEKLKAEFQKALEETAAEVGHEAATLRSQYLVPGLEDDFMRDGSVKTKLDKRAGGVWYLHATRTDLARLIMSSKVLLGRHSRKVGREAVFAATDTPASRRAALKWAEAKYLFFKNPGKGGVALFRFQADRAPDADRRGEFIWFGDLSISRSEILTIKSEAQLEEEMNGRRARVLAARFLIEGTKSDGEKEQEEVERLNRRNPTKKPPRKDLRRNRMETDDPDLKGGVEGDKDLSLNYKKVAALAERFLWAHLRLAEATRNPGGPPWKTDDGKWVAMNPDGNTQTFGKEPVDKARAESFAKGKEFDEAAWSEEQQKEKEQDAKAQAEAERAAFQETANAILKSIPDLPEDVAAFLRKAVNKGDGDLFRSFRAHQKELMDGLLQGYTKDRVKDLSKDPFKGVEKGDSDALGEALVRAVLRERLLINPSSVGGKVLSEKALEGDALVDRSRDAFRQYRHVTPEMRKEAAAKAATQLDALPKDSPQRAELEAIVNGLYMAATLRGENLDAKRKDGTLLRDPLNDKTKLLFRELVSQSDSWSDDKFKVLLTSSPDALYAKEGRAVVRDALDAMDPDTLTELAEGQPWGKIGPLLTDPNIDPEVQDYLREFMSDMMVNNMTTMQGAVAMLSRGKMKADPSTEAEVYDEVAKELREKVEGPVGEAVDEALRACVESGQNVAECLEAASKKVGQAQMKGVTEVVEEWDGEVDATSVPVALARSITEGAPFSILEEEWFQEEPLADRKEEFLRNLDDPEEQERVRQMTDEEFLALERTVKNRL